MNLDDVGFHSGQLKQDVSRKCYKATSSPTFLHSYFVLSVLIMLIIGLGDKTKSSSHKDMI